MLSLAQLPIGSLVYTPLSDIWKFIFLKGGQFSLAYYDILLNCYFSLYSSFFKLLMLLQFIFIPPTRQRCGVYWFHSVRLSARPSRIPCPLCSTYSSGWIHFIFIHLIKQLQKVCRISSFLQNVKIWIFGNFLKFVTLTLSCFDLGSDVKH